MNNSLLYDTDYVDLIKKTIKKTTCQYAIIADDPDYFKNASNEELEIFYAAHSPESIQTLPLSLNPELFLDMILMEVRRVTILFSAEKSEIV